MKIGVVSPPAGELCGIASFNEDMLRALRQVAPSWSTEVLSVVRPGRCSRPSEAHGGRDFNYVDATCGPCLDAVAEWSVRQRFDITVLQHEYGLYGTEGSPGDVWLAERLRGRLAVIAHTVLQAPTQDQDDRLRKLLELASSVGVLSSVALVRAEGVYGMAPERIALLRHGSWLRPEVTERPRGWLRFGSIGFVGASKGYGWAIPAWGRSRASTQATWEIVGSAHPEDRDATIVMQQLMQQVQRVHNVHLHPRYVSTEEFGRRVGTFDVALLPYIDMEQVSSGILANVIAAGVPFLATRFPHARDFGDTGGWLVGDEGEWVSALDRLGKDWELLSTLRRAAVRRSGTLWWPNAVRDYSEWIERTAAA